MTLSCPRCHTAFVVRRRRAQTTATAIGGSARAIQRPSIAITEAGVNTVPMGEIAGASLALACVVARRNVPPGGDQRAD
jgi:hypothetical protein